MVEDNRDKKIKDLQKALNISRDANQFVAGVDAISYWQEVLNKFSKDQLIKTILNDIKKCQKAELKVKEILGEL
jgi:cell fate (sporulation/competence/biofilm development) regulator YmcA (YheA/YmcA/DUF963 family)